MSGVVGPWMQTSWGLFDFGSMTLTPTEDREAFLRHLAGALSKVNRYTGHTLRPYSVAEHSINVARALEFAGHPRDLQLAGLLHDAHEAFIGDLTFPVQMVLRGRLPGFRECWKQLAREIDAVILRELGVAADLEHPAVKDADARILLNERDALLGPPPARWEVEDLGPLPGVEISRDHVSDLVVAGRFVTAFRRLVRT